MALNTIISVVALLCAVWVIYDVWAVSKKKDVVIKIVWTIAAIVFSIITAIVYYLVEKK